MPLCQLSSTSLYYVERGQGEPIVFLQGLAGDCLSWMGQLKHFGREYRCIAVENRDVGQSAYAAGAYATADIAVDVAEILGQLRAEPAHVVGVSMGGMVAQELAVARPELVRSIVLVNTLACSDEWFQGTLAAFELIRRHVPSTASFFEAILPWWVSHRFFEDSGRVSWLKWLLAQAPYDQRVDGFARQIDACRRHDARSRLGRVACPVLIVNGEDDRIMPVRYADELQALIPHAQRRTLSGIGHALPVEDPGQFNAVVRQFLTTLRSPRRSTA